MLSTWKAGRGVPSVLAGAVVSWIAPDPPRNRTPFGSKYPQVDPICILSILEALTQALFIYLEHQGMLRWAFQKVLKYGHNPR